MFKSSGLISWLTSRSVICIGDFLGVDCLITTSGTDSLELCLGVLCSSGSSSSSLSPRCDSVSNWWVGEVILADCLKAVLEGPKSLQNSESMPDRHLDVLDHSDTAVPVDSIVFSVAEQVLV